MSLFEKIGKAMTSTYNFLTGENEEKESEDPREKLNLALNKKLLELEAFKEVVEKTSAIAAEGEMELKEEEEKVEKIRRKAEEALDRGTEELALEIMKEEIVANEKLERARNWCLTAGREADKALKDFNEKQSEIDKFIDGMKYLSRIDEVSKVMENKQKVLESNKFDEVEGADFLFNEASADILGRSEQIKGKEKLVITDKERLEKDLKDARITGQAKEALEELRRKKGLSTTPEDMDIKAIEEKEMPDM